MSWSAEIGTIPLRLTKPTVGLIPTMPSAVAGPMMEPEVSVPMHTAARFAAALGRLQDVLTSAPFHLSELAALGFRMN